MQKHRFKIKWWVSRLKLWFMTFLMHFGALTFVEVVGLCIFGDAAITTVGFVVAVIIATALFAWLLGSTVRIHRE